MTHRPTTPEHTLAGQTSVAWEIPPGIISLFTHWGFAAAAILLPLGGRSSCFIFFSERKISRRGTKVRPATARTRNAEACAASKVHGAVMVRNVLEIAWFLAAISPNRMPSRGQTPDMDAFRSPRTHWAMIGSGCRPYRMSVIGSPSQILNGRPCRSWIS